ncbi:hypothetical protein [Dactylosporangium sp. NPDC049140]|uniref:hypothetical protein n=1 Tax=Dactylosporangium sp. NPDC049140 TaxID=3155647 RepID=UPI0033FFC441
MLADPGGPLFDLPLRERRARLEVLLAGAPQLHLCRPPTDVHEARRWAADWEAARRTRQPFACNTTPIRP